MNKLVRYRIIALAGIALCACASAAALPLVKSIEPPQDILFIGNSFTYYNNSLHNHVREMMRAGGKQVGRVRSVTISGARLASHTPALGPQLESNNWDAVVLQGNSTEAIDDRYVEGFKSAVRDHSKAVQSAGSRSVLFMTWARSDAPEQTKALNEAYTGIGNETGSLVVPVGLAFERSRQQNGELALHVADRRHPTLAGTYLAACTFYAALFRESPLGNPYTAGLDEVTARALQGVAWETVSQYYNVVQ